jgi:hypothetical protein
VELFDALRELHRELQGLPLTPAFSIPDNALYNFAIDVFEQGEAARVASTLKAPRPALTNARAAFESAIDAQFLVSSETDYVTRGCYARVFELLEIERVGREADMFTGRLPGASEEVENTIREEAKAWSDAVPGRGRALLGAFEELQKDRRRHWSGHSREELHQAVAGSSPASAEFAKQLGVVFSVLSIESHPRPRTGQRPTETIGPNQFLYKPDPGHGPRAREVAAIAAQLASGAIRIRRKFAPQASP